MGTEPRKIRLEFSIPMSLALNSNALNNMHHRKRAPITAELLDMGRAHMRNTIGPQPLGNPLMGRALAEVTIAWPDKIRRDSHNFMAMLKPLIDGYVKSGLIADDSDAYLIGPHITPADRLYKAPYGKHAWLEWTITEIQPQPKF